MADEIKTAIENLGRTFEEFKSENDARIKAIETKGHADPLLVEKVDKINAAIGDLDKIKSRIDEVEKKANRRGASADEDPAKEKAKAHSKAFGTYLRKGRAEPLAEFEKAMSVGTDADGGFAVPEELSREILAVELDATPMREICKVITASESFEQLVSQHGATSGWVDEDDARAETDTPTLASVKPSFGEVYAAPQATQKILDDAFFNVEAWLAEEVGTEFAVEEDAKFVAGNGTKAPKGILAYTIAAAPTFGQIKRILSGVDSTISGDNLIDLIHGVKARYRRNGRFLMADLTAAAIRKLKNSVSGDYLWVPGLTAGASSTLLGYPVTEDENVPAMGVDSNSVIFGDFRRGYLIVDLPFGVRMLRDPYTVVPKIRFYSTKRVGGGLLDSNALAVLQLGTGS